MNRGYLIVAINNGDTDYVRLARVLRDSIHRSMPDAKVSVMTNVDITDSRWDHVIKVFDVDNSDWKLGNDWQVYHATPYEYTVKLEADMYIPRNIDWWWDTLKDRDLHVCTTIRDFRGNISGEKFYRKTFTVNKLPDTYNAITYFRRSNTAENFYNYVQNIFENWDEWTKLLTYSTENRPTTDVVYGIAAKIVGEELTTIPWLTDISMSHMKPMIMGTITDRWWEQLTYEISPEVFRVNSYTQMYPIHYWGKEFAPIIDEELSHHGQ